MANVPLSLGIRAGVPYNWAVTLDNINFGAASWTPYTSSNITANLGTAPGWHTVWVGLRGLPANAQQTWNAIRPNLSLTPPLLVITNPVASTVTVPVIQLEGFCSEPLRSISYDLTNANGLVTNQQVLVVDQYYDTNTWAFTTNSFQAFDVPLTNGWNTFTLHATDLAGNVTAANFSFNLDYSSKTNPPIVQITWPANGSLVSGASFTCRGWVSDPTATVTTSAVDANGNTNLYTGAVGRDGNFWLQNIPLNAGTSVFAISVTDVLGSNTVTNINITQSALQLTVYPVDPDSQLWQPTVELYGVISDPTCSVWVNGVEATCDVYGDWCAEAVPVNVNGAANFDVTAFATGQTAPSGAMSLVQPKPIRVYVASYSETSSYSCQTRYTNFPTPGTWWNWTGSGTKTINWTDGASGVQNESNYVQLICFASDLNYTNLTPAFTYWPVSSWPNIPYGTCLDYYTDVYATETINGTNTYTNFVSPIVLEHCSILVPSPDESGTYIGGSSSSVTVFAKGSRHEQPTIKMQTGGPPGSTNLNLFVISTTATNMPIIKAPPPDWYQVNGPPTPIWPTNIMIGSLGYLGADGRLYVVLPDNTEADITPTVPGLPYITFGDTNGDPVSATKYPAQIYLNQKYVTGMNTIVSGTNTTVIVGQEIYLTFTNIPGATMSNFSWSVPGTPAWDFDVSTFEGYGMLSNLTRTNISYAEFFWVADGTFTVTCSADFAGLSTSATATFTVVRPTAKITTFTGRIAADGNYYHNTNVYTLHFGTPIEKAGRAGILFSNTITLPAGNYNWGSTNYSNVWVQLVNSSVPQFQTNNSIGTWYQLGPLITNPVLDTRWPYAYPSSKANITIDAPSLPLYVNGTNAPYKTVSADATFTMYVMFQPTNGNCVPLARVDWGWSGTAILTNVPQSPFWSFSDWNYWVLTSSNHSSNSIGTSTTNYPLWTDNILNHRTMTNSP